MNPSPNEFDFQQEIQIKASLEAVWNALTRSEEVNRYHMTPLLTIELEKGGRLIYGTEKEVMISGNSLEIEPYVKWSHSFRFGPERHAGTEGDPDTLVTYELRPDGEGTHLKLTHSGFPEENQTRANIAGGWPYILAELKGYLENTSGELIGKKIV